MYFDNVSVKFRQHLRDSFTVSIEFTRTEDDWMLVKNGATRLFIEYLNDLVVSRGPPRIVRTA
jgi:hypothetical protein